MSAVLTRPAPDRPLRVLAPADLAQFLADGYVIVRDAFPADAAAEVRAQLFARLKINPDDRATWTQRFVHLPETLHGPAVELCYTPRVLGAFDDLLGAGRWVRPGGLGWWPVIFPGFDQPPWQPPLQGWHVDGQHFHHRLTSREQGLLTLFLFSDMGPGDGGTAIAAGSHRVTARVLAAAEPAGLAANAISPAVNRFPRPRVVQLCGRAGDVAVLHPFMSHSASANVGSRVRVVCNPCIALHEPMQLDRPVPGDHSPVEEAIRQALAGPRPDEPDAPAR